jgi:hypothetical protein
MHMVVKRQQTGKGCAAKFGGAHMKESIVNRLAIFVLLFAVVALAACGPKATPEPTPTPTTEAAPTQVAPTPTQAPPTPTTPVEAEEAYPAPPEEEEIGEYPAPEQPVAPDSEAYPEPEEAGDPDATSRWVFDGVISEGEYSGQLVFGPIAVFWANDDTYLYLAAEAQTQGWLGIGLDPDRQMQGADFTIAAFDGEPKIWDAWGQGTTGATHPPDTELGGSMDILEWAAVQDGPFFRFEALRLLNSGDPYDKPLEPGQTYDIIVGVGTSAAFDAPHAYRGQGQITLD